MKIDLNTGGFVIEITIAVKQTTANDMAAPEPIAIEQAGEQNPAVKKRGRPSKTFVFNFEAFAGETAWREKLGKTLNLTNDEIDERVRRFISFCELTGKEHFKLHQAKAHFYNWIKRQLAIEKTSNPSAGAYKSTDDDKRAREYADYYQWDLNNSDNGY